MDTNVEAVSGSLGSQKNRAIEIGTAGEHVVCADLLLSGWRAFQSAQGLPYDVVVEVNGKLLRVAVKSTARPRPRPAREGSRVCYQFSATRNRRLHTGKTDARRITEEHADLVAFVALDTRAVAYLPIASCPGSFHVDAPGHTAGTNKFGPKGIKRKRFEQFSLTSALRSLGVAQ